MQNAHSIDVRLFSLSGIGVQERNHNYFKSEHIPSKVIVELSEVVLGLWEITRSTSVDPVQVRDAIVAQNSSELVYYRRRQWNKKILSRISGR